MTMQEPPELHALEGVIPVVQTQTRGEWAVTLVSLERWDRGFVANFDIHHDTDSPPPASPGDAPEQLPPHLAPAVRDDRGARYRPWGGGGTGMPRRTACDWRLSYNCTPALDPAARELRLEIAEVRLMGDDEARGRLVVDEAYPGPWTFVVTLPAE